MLALEDEISTLASLDTLRSEAQGMLQAGLYGLGGSTYEAHEHWEAPGLERARVEHALLLRAMRIARKRGLMPDGVYGEVLERTAQEFLSAITARSLMSSEEGNASVLIASRSLEAMATMPGYVLSTAAVACLYRVLRELFSSEPPLWAMGSARAGEGGRATAFVTGECCKGILWLSRSFSHAADLCWNLGRVQSRRTSLAALVRMPAQWREVELHRIQKALDIDVIWMQRRTVFVLGDIATDDVADVALNFGNQVERMIAQIAEARREILGARALEDSGIAHTESSHRAAIDAIDDLSARLRDLSRSLLATDWAKSGDLLRDLAESVHEHLEPSQNFIGSVLDHELAAAAAQRSDRDLPELAFAAAAYGMLVGSWDDPRLHRVAEVLVEGLSDGGRLPAGRPFQVQHSGFHLHPVGAEVVRGLAALFRRMHHVITPELVASLLRQFRNTQRDVPGGSGWATETPIDPHKASWWNSALSVIALESVVQMLNTCLNERVTAHFSTSHPARLKVDLEEAFYPDYGLVRADRPSVALLLQRMRAHVIGLSRNEFRDPLNSIVLYGPPGTGKTTLAEALARSARTIFIHVTPSDIVLGGAEHAEHRARVVFQALAMLTDAVILFDEFDSLLRRRPADGRVPSTIFELLTPGMLPKLERLHDASRDQRVAFVLATNLVGSLDNAAIRDGRFDEKVGVYPPDLTSRLGRLLFVKRPTTPDHELRLARVCALTHDSPMSTLGRKGWFTRDSHPIDGSGQAYIDDPTKSPRWPTPEFDELRPSGEGKHAELEFAEWLWSRTADWSLVDGPLPAGDLQEYLRSTSWSELQAEVGRQLDRVGGGQRGPRVPAGMERVHRLGLRRDAAKPGRRAPPRCAAAADSVHRARAEREPLRVTRPLTPR